MSSLALSRRTMTNTTLPKLPPLRSAATGGGVSPGPRAPLKAGNGMGWTTSPVVPGQPYDTGPTDRVAAGVPPVSGWGEDYNASATGEGSSIGLPDSVWSGMYADQERQIMGNAGETAALARERAIAGGYQNSGYYKNLMRKLGAETNAQLAVARRSVQAQQAQAAREDRWRLLQMRQQGYGGLGLGQTHYRTAPVRSSRDTEPRATKRNIPPGPGADAAVAGAMAGQAPELVPNSMSDLATSSAPSGFPLDFSSGL